MGNVALDVARILCKTYDELALTDIADHALEALKNSKVKNVYILGRRGPAQAAFTPPEIKELGEFDHADVTVPSDEAFVDPASQAIIDGSGDKDAQKNIDFIQEYARRPVEGKSRLLTIRFLVSTLDLIGEDGKVSAIKLIKNELVQSDDGSVYPRATDREETISVGLVFRSVGYKGLPLPNIPYHQDWGTILNKAGRVVDESGDAVTGLYTAGWIKRGPSGVIGTNKTCAKETVSCMVEDLAAGRFNEPEDPSIEAAAALVEEREPEAISYQQWQTIDAEEVRKGEAQGRPRVKFTRVADMVSVGKN
jgi:ferredoxin--NADP+ reductase